MADRNIKKEVKKLKKSDKKPAALSSPSERPMMPQPELIKKDRKSK